MTTTSQALFYPKPQLLINGSWRDGDHGVCGVVRNPATGEVLSEVPQASGEDLDEALDGSLRAFAIWRKTAALDRAAVLRRAASLLRERLPELARHMTLEQGKTLAESRLEFELSAEALEWYAAEALRANGRIIPARARGARQMVIPQPVGPVAAFTPWNFPAVLPARKIGAALAAGCAVIIKPSEETPASTIGLAKALMDAGLPEGTLNLVLGIPAEVSRHLIQSPIIRKVTFTGSTPVGREIAQLAAAYAKPCTLELGGHAPVLVFDDADLDHAIRTCAIGKTRNAGQVCTSPTRFYVQDRIYQEFSSGFAEAMNAMKVGPGMAPESQMGALANVRRMTAIESLVDDAHAAGGKIIAGGERLADVGYLWRPTVISDVPSSARAMQVEPFGPLALVNRFNTLEEGLTLANNHPFGLAAYAFTQSSRTAAAIADELEAGGIGINTFAVAQIEAPFGGVKDSGYGTEGGHEGLEAYMHPKYVHHAP